MEAGRPSNRLQTVRQPIGEGDERELGVKEVSQFVCDGCDFTTFSKDAIDRHVCGKK